MWLFYLDPTYDQATISADLLPSKEGTMGRRAAVSWPSRGGSKKDSSQSRKVEGRR